MSGLKIAKESQNAPEPTDIGRIAFERYSADPLMDREMAIRCFLGKDIARLVDFFETMQGNTGRYLDLFAVTDAEKSKYLFGTLTLLQQEENSEHRERWEKLEAVYEQTVRSMMKAKALKALEDDPKQTPATTLKVIQYWLVGSQISTLENAKAKAKSDVRNQGGKKKARSILSSIRNNPEVEE